MSDSQAPMSWAPAHGLPATAVPPMPRRLNANAAQTILETSSPPTSGQRRMGTRLGSASASAAFAVAFAFVLGGSIGCGGRQGAGATMPQSGTSDASQPAGANAGQSAGESDHDMVVKAALPYRVLRADGGQEIDEGTFWRELADADAVCIGETHRNPHHHWAQLHIVDTMSESAADRTMALGMEMFQRPFQGVLDDYAGGRIDEDAMLSRTGWEDRWGYDFALYRPIIELAVVRQLALLALNISDEVRQKVSKKGLEGLSEAERQRVPDMDLDNEQHQAWFDDIMAAMGGAHGHGGGGHGGAHGDDGGERARRIYTVQVLWDETMADSAATWLAAGDSAGQRRQILILAGNGHCHDSAMISRMQRRGVERVVSVRPIVEGGDRESVAAELAEPISDYLFVMSY